MQKPPVPLVATGISHEDQTLDGRGSLVHTKELLISVCSLKKLYLEEEQAEIKRKVNVGANLALVKMFLLLFLHRALLFSRSGKSFSFPNGGCNHAGVLPRLAGIPALLCEGPPAPDLWWGRPLLRCMFLQHSLKSSLEQN